MVIQTLIGQAVTDQKSNEALHSDFSPRMMFLELCQFAEPLKIFQLNYCPHTVNLIPLFLTILHVPSKTPMDPHGCGSQLKTTGKVNVHVNSPFGPLKVAGVLGINHQGISVFTKSSFQFQSWESRPASRWSHQFSPMAFRTFLLVENHSNLPERSLSPLPEARQG